MTFLTSNGPAVAAVRCVRPAGPTRSEQALLSCIISCGECDACHDRMYSNLPVGSWVACRTFDDDAPVSLSDIVPTGFNDAANVAAMGAPVTARH